MGAPAPCCSRVSGLQPAAFVEVDAPVGVGGAGAEMAVVLVSHEGCSSCCRGMSALLSLRTTRLGQARDKAKQERGSEEGQLERGLGLFRGPWAGSLSGPGLGPEYGGDAKLSRDEMLWFQPVCMSAGTILWFLRTRRRPGPLPTLPGQLLLRTGWGWGDDAWAGAHLQGSWGQSTHSHCQSSGHFLKYSTEVHSAVAISIHLCSYWMHA